MCNGRSVIFEKAEKNRAAILRRTAAESLCELSSKPDWWAKRYLIIIQIMFKYPNLAPPDAGEGGHPPKEGRPNREGHRRPPPPWGPGGRGGGGGWRGGLKGGLNWAKLGWGHMGLLYKAPTDYTKPFSNGLNKAPTDNTKPLKTIQILKIR